MKNNIRGWKEIFSFTFVQSMKSKSVKIATIIMCVLALVSMPIVSAIKSSDSEKKETTIKQVKVEDMTGYGLIDNIEKLKASDLYEDNQSHLYENIEYSEAELPIENYGPDTKLKDMYTFEENSEYIYMQISYAEGSFQIQMIYSEDTEIDSDDVDDYSEFIQNNFREVIESLYELDDGALRILESENVVSGYEISEISEINNDNAENDNNKARTDEMKESGKKDSEVNSHYAYNIMYLMLMVVMLTLAFCGERIAMSIVTEKSSKVMEYLMTSIKPMAIVVGKILSNLLVLFIQMGLVCISFVVSIVINGVIFNKDGKIIPSYLSKIFNMDNFSGLNLFNILLVILIILAGYILFGLIAALAGASVSKMDEMAEGVKIYSIILIIGAYIGIFVLSSGLYDDSSLIKDVIMVVPITSVFIAPGALITGYLSTYIAIISAVILVASVVLMTKFVANVYESMVYYNGAVLKIKDIINISKQNSKKKGKELKE